ncbi:MAG: hypothetical protein J7K73_04420 [Nanoarchaeota archaeon]|nr:hypothetical protein [Nanoarchaeota archaeon]
MKIIVLIVGILIALFGALISGFLPVPINLGISLPEIAGISGNLLVIGVGVIITVIGAILPSF